MNFSGLTRTASPMLQLNARAQMRVQHSIFMVINAQHWLQQVCSHLEPKIRI